MANLTFVIANTVQNALSLIMHFYDHSKCNSKCIFNDKSRSKCCFEWLFHSQYREKKQFEQYLL